ncbi:MAG: pantetheine-phosphate adenylyltransferase [Alicyclobacillus sp.]|nr:pantetheine-phosphate adenylyltransferase [Alicyclobacillus sp.]
MHKAVFPGSFDPVTCGHLDVLARAARLFDEVVVAVLENPDKQPLFTTAERVRLIQVAVAEAGLQNVTVDSFSGLLVEYVRLVGARAVVRGVRGVSDVAAETMLAQMNRRLNPAAETVFLPANPEYSYVSSSLLKQVASLGGPLAGLVPPHVAAALQAKWPRSAADRNQP